MVLNGAGATDSSGNSVRVLLVDYRKDFDLIAWSVTSDNLRTAYPEFYYINWLISFLCYLKQGVKLARDSSLNRALFLVVDAYFQYD